MERAQRAVRVELGLMGPTPPLRYWVASPEETSLQCPPRAAACASRNWVISPNPLHLHELVHAVTLDTRPPSFLSEGLAETLGCLGPDDAVSLSNELSDSALTQTQAFYSIGNYSAANSFVSFLIDQGGPVTFMEFYAAASEGDSIETLDRHATEVWGESLSSLRARWMSQPPTLHSAACRPVFQCSEPALASGPITLVRGISQNVNRAGIVRTFNVTEETNFTLRVNAPGPSVHVGSCDRRPHPGDWRASGGVVEVSTRLAPGRYFVWVTGVVVSPSDAEIEADFEVILVP